jgi:hypothetical protein
MDLVGRLTRKRSFLLRFQSLTHDLEEETVLTELSKEHGLFFVT